LDVPVTYRSATLEDAALGADLMTAAYPPLPHDPVITRYRWERPRTGYTQERFIAENGIRPIAYLEFFHGPWEKLPDRHCEVEAWLPRAELDQELLVQLWSWIGDRAVEDGSRLLLAFCGEDEPEALEALAALGYQRERAEKVWELDLKANGARLVADAHSSRQKAATDGIELVTLDAWDDPDRLRKLYEMDAVTRLDVPTSLPIITETFEDFQRRLSGPDRRADRTWIALDGARPVAVSYLRFPPVRGIVWTGYTASHPEYRGRGLAKAVKLQTLAQAVDLALPYVCTDNDAENAAMLHINEKLGYVRRPGFVEHHKRVTNRGA